MKTASAAAGEALHGFAGLASHFGRSFLSPFHPSCSGEERLPFHHTRPEGHQDNRVSIGKTTKGVNPNCLWKYDPSDFIVSSLRLFEEAVRIPAKALKVTFNTITRVHYDCNKNELPR
jgi:hypothetical protein